MTKEPRSLLDFLYDVIYLNSKRLMSPVSIECLGGGIRRLDLLVTHKVVCLSKALSENYQVEWEILQ